MKGKYSEIPDLKYVRLTEADFNMIRDTATGIYVEVGTYHGASAYAASFNAKEVHTIDIFRWSPHLFDEMLVRRNIQFFKGTSEDFIKGWHTEINTLFVDGSHEYDYVKKDIEALIPFVKSGGWVMFHDYHPQSAGVKPAVDEWLATITPKQVIHPIPGVCKILKIQIPWHPT